jgi:hypothetical protein
MSDDRTDVVEVRPASMAMPSEVTREPEAHATELNVLKDIQTRFLFPFFFARHHVKEVAEALLAQRLPARDGKEPRPLWECAAPPQAYKDELFDHVGDFLFGSPVERGCGYLKINEIVTNSWFGGAVLEDLSMPVRLVSDARIELFLSPQGIGVLSMALSPEKVIMHLDEASDFNYRLAQFRRHPLARLRRPHPRDDAGTWPRVSEQSRERRIPDPPPDDALLAARRGTAGGRFELRELVADLLGPLDGYDVHSVQEEMMVYTVARFGPEADFGWEAVRQQLAPFLSGLAQVEEANHAGAPPGEVTTANVLLNRRHWGAAGLLGSAHLIADQPGDVSFNEQKMSVVRDKYFIPFLMALLQRLALNRAIEEAIPWLVASESPKEAELLEALRTDLLKFAVRGRFTQITCRQALHRYYQVVQEGLDVENAWQELRRALADLDAKRHAVTQRQIGRDTNASLSHATQTAQEVSRLAQGMQKNLGTVADVQLKVEQIEVVIISVYLAHLWHMIASENDRLYSTIRGMDLRYQIWFPDIYSFRSWSVAFVAMISLLAFGVYLLRNWKWYKVLCIAAVIGCGACLFVLPWGSVVTPLLDEPARLGWSYTIGALVGAIGAAAAALILKPWRYLKRPNEELAGTPG